MNLLKLFPLLTLFAFTEVFANGAMPRYITDARKLNLPKDCPNDPSGLSCVIAKLPMDSNHIYESCKSNPEKFEMVYYQPEFQKYLREKGKARAVVRREQFKMIMNTELNYAVRIPEDSPLFEKTWSELRSRWERRAKENPELLEIDTDSLVHPDRCGLHQMLGLDCGDQPGFDFIGMKKEEATELSKNEAGRRPYKWGLAYKLLKYELLKSASESSTPSDIDLDKAPKELKLLLEEEKKFPINTVYRDFPEFGLSSGFNNTVFNVAVSTGLIRKLNEEMYKLRELKKSRKEHLSFYDKAILIERVMLEVLKERALTPYQESRIESQFYQNYSELLKSFEDHLQKSKSDSQWAFSQDYLMGAYMMLAHARNDRFSEGVMQTVICHNAITQDENESQKEIMMAIGGLIALGTGFGALFVGGSYAIALLAVSFGMMNAISAVDVYTAYQAEQASKYEFLYRSTEFTQLEASHQAYIKTLPWAFLNVALVSPIFAMRKIAIAERAAQLAGDTDKVAHLRLYKKAISASMFAVNAGITGMNAEAGYDAFLRILKSFKDKEDKLVTPAVLK